MRLRQATITGYRSIRKATTLHVEANVTVVLGPNDHGKTNCLSALLHLNDDTPFAEDSDLNWDVEVTEGLPSVLGQFSLSDEDIDRILECENALNEEHNAKLEAKKAAAVASETTDSDSSQAPDAEADEPFDLLTKEDLLKGVVAKRVGQQGTLEIEASVPLFPATYKLVKTMLPRFELINPVAKLSDSVTVEELAAGQNEFMRGIFYYAGLDPNVAAPLFEQTDRTSRRLAQASEKLDRTLRETWTQGQNLKFELRHDSKTSRIELLIEDPAVTSRYVRASRRSSGFTHYFALKTILYARQRDHEANSYFLMFDEPGIYLHPSGQYDLLQVLETLARESQVVYVTHSLFMINKTFPTRHRLLMKSDEGTTLDGKPYVGRWESVLSSLGMTLTGTILFSNYVVLTEGDSDPIYMYAMLQKGVLAGKCRVDLNAVGFISSGEAKNADVLVRLLNETTPRPKIAVITDGDQGGRERLVYLNALIKEQGIVERILSKDTSIEDHLPNIRDVYVPAVADYCGKLMGMKETKKPDEAELKQKFLEHFEKAFDKTGVTTKVAEWATKAAADICGLTSRPSKVGIAREYAMRLLALPDGQLKWEKRTKSIAEWLVKEVEVPEIAPVQKAILQSEES